MSVDYLLKDEMDLAKAQVAWDFRYRADNDNHIRTCQPEEANDYLIDTEKSIRQNCRCCVIFIPYLGTKPGLSDRRGANDDDI